MRIIYLIFLSSVFNKNIIQREIESQNYHNDKFIITEEIKKYYSNDLEIYVSIIDPEIQNYKYIHKSEGNLKENYYNSYNDLFGNDFRYFRDSNMTMIPTTSENSIKLNQSEILLEKYEIPDNELKINVLIMRNYFFTSFSCENFDPSFIKFFDINIAMTDTCPFTGLNILIGKDYKRILNESYLKISRKKRLNSLMSKLLNRNVKYKLTKRIVNVILKTI
jgi:hypothetical protein